MLITLSIAILTGLMVEGTVLDPALYLAPSPPLILTSDSIPPEELWLQSIEARTEHVAREVKFKGESVKAETNRKAVETGRMFWPRYSAPQPALGINIPLTFSLSGSYGKPAISPSGVIGNTYTSITSLGSGLGGLGSSLLGKTAVASTASVYGNYGKSALAGSSYGTYGVTSGVRVYGSNNAASWGGWGNGKWGHYGKG